MKFKTPKTINEIEIYKQLKFNHMTTNLISIDSNVVIEKRNDLRIYASDSETLNEEPVLKTECNCFKDFDRYSFKLEPEFFSKKYLYFVKDKYDYHGEITDTYTLKLKKEDNKYIGRESEYDLDNDSLKSHNNDFRATLTYWGERNDLSIRITKYIRPAFKSQSKYFPKKETFISTCLGNKKRTQLTDNELSIVNLFFGSGYFDIDWFFRYSRLNDELKLTVQDFDMIIESLLGKRVLEKDPSGITYNLYVTV